MAKDEEKLRKDIEKILSKEEYFTDITWSYLKNCLNRYETKDYLSAGVWASIFAESLIKDCLTEIGESYTNEDELARLLNILKDTKKCPRDSSYYQRIASRANEIRLKRNRLVHDTRADSEDIPETVDDMISNVRIIVLNNYLDTQVCARINKANTKKNNTEAEKKPEPYFPVFISTITPDTFEQTAFIEGFCNRLKDIGVIPVRCHFDEFDKSDPVGKVKKMISECNAFIAIGLERSHVYYYKDREGSERENENIHRRYTSGWLQLESGIAIGLGKQIYVLRQENLYDDGIFDSEWHTYPPLLLELPLDIYDSKVDTLLNKLKEYMSECNDKEERS